MRRVDGAKVHAPYPVEICMLAARLVVPGGVTTVCRSQPGPWWSSAHGGEGPI